MLLLSICIREVFFKYIYFLSILNVLSDKNMKACMSPLQVTRSQQSSRVPDDSIKSRKVSTGLGALRKVLAVQARYPKFNPQNA